MFYFDSEKGKYIIGKNDFQKLFKINGIFGKIEFDKDALNTLCDLFYTDKVEVTGTLKHSMKKFSKYKETFELDKYFTQLAKNWYSIR